MHKVKKFSSEKGFALVVTLSLMVLLGILAVSLLTLSSISLRNSSQSTALHEARANARMGLLLALSRLQEEAGDDRRVTAAADIKMMNPDGTPNTNSHESRYWTGVWSDPSPTNEIYTKTPTAQFRRWLVSGDPVSLVQRQLYLPPDDN
jgi:Tfp pilus assembly protein PilX